MSFMKLSIRQIPQSRTAEQVLHIKKLLFVCAHFSSIDTKTGTIQRLAWSLREEDTKIWEALHIFIL